MSSSYDESPSWISGGVIEENSESSSWRSGWEIEESSEGVSSWIDDADERFLDKQFEIVDLFAIMNDYFLYFVTLLYEELQKNDITNQNDNYVDFIIIRERQSEESYLYVQNITSRREILYGDPVFKIPIYTGSIFEADLLHEIKIPISKFQSNFRLIEKNIQSQKRGYVVFYYPDLVGGYKRKIQSSKKFENDIIFLNFFSISYKNVHELKKAKLPDDLLYKEVDQCITKCYMDIEYFQGLSKLDSPSELIFQNYLDYLNTELFLQLPYEIPICVKYKILYFIPCVYAFYIWYQARFNEYLIIEQQIEELKHEQRLINISLKTGKEDASKKRKQQFQITDKKQEKRKKYLKIRR